MTVWSTQTSTVSRNVSIPSGVKSGALVAVSQTPGTAASAPLLLGGDTC